MATGTLQVRVTAGGGVTPVAGANVAITDILGYLAYSLTTDQNGLTEPVNLFAPAKDFYTLSLTTRPAYSLYQMTVSHPDYNTQIVRGVQVFDGVGSMLPIDLSARPARAGLTLLDVVDIPPSGVSMRLGESL